MIALACDHGALDLKKAIMAHLDKRGLAYKDFGCYTKDSCDYPDFAGPAAQAVASGECDRGIVCCTTGIGVSITANKVKGIRCALLDNPMSARLTREHNDTNMMALGAAVTGEMLALEIVDVWLDTEFSHAERHQRQGDGDIGPRAEALRVPDHDVRPLERALEDAHEVKMRDIDRVAGLFKQQAIHRTAPFRSDAGRRSHCSACGSRAWIPSAAPFRARAAGSSW